MNRMLFAIAALAMTAGTVAVAAPANAASADDVVSISIAGLNPADIDRRIRTAARDICGSDLIQPLRQKERAAACEEGVTAEARSAVRLAAARQATPLRLALRAR